MKNRSMITAFCLGLGMMAVIGLGKANAQVDSEVLFTIKPVGKTLDTAMSSDGKFFFVLTEGSQIEIFEAGKANGTFDAHKGVTSIESNAKGDTLFLSDPEGGSIQIVAVQYIKDIKTAGAPFKGPKNAPVELAAFIDFQ